MLYYRIKCMEASNICQVQQFRPQTNMIFFDYQIKTSMNPPMPTNKKSGEIILRPVMIAIFFC
jgi:hypothetical protein